MAKQMTVLQSDMEEVIEKHGGQYTLQEELVRLYACYTPSPAMQQLLTNDCKPKVIQRGITTTKNLIIPWVL